MDPAVYWVTGGLLVGLVIGLLFGGYTFTAGHGSVCVLFYGSVPHGVFTRVRVPFISRAHVRCIPNGVGMGGGWRFLNMKELLTYVQDARVGPEALDELLDALAVLRAKERDLTPAERASIDRWYDPPTWRAV